MKINLQQLIQSKAKSAAMNRRQLYLNNDFALPQIQHITLNPFPPHPVDIAADEARDASLASIFHSPTSPIPVHAVGYSHSFQQICAKENLFPFMLSTSSNRLAVICRDCILLCEWSANPQGGASGDNLIRIERSERIRVQDVPTVVKVGKFNLFVGYQNGKIAQYCLKTRSWQGSNEELQFPVMGLEVLTEEEGKEASVAGLDSAGNLLVVTFSHKTFMDKIIKTLTATRWVSFVFRNKKREKIKKLFKGLLSKKDKQNKQSKEKEKDKDSLRQGGQMGDGDAFPYHYNRFHFKRIGQDVVVSLFRNNTLQLLLLDSNYHYKKTIPIEDAPSQQEAEIAFLELGEGGFEHSNTTHHILVVGIGKILSFYRLIPIEDGYQVVKISQTQLPQKLLYGGFVSNNLLCVGDRTGISLLNTTGQPIHLFAIDQDKFSYIDFFIEQDALDMDKQLIYQHLMTLLPNWLPRGDRVLLTLEGKRLLAGRLLSWQSVLVGLISAGKWQQAIRTYSQIYWGKFKQCCGISESISDRNKQMRELCQTIALGYIGQKNISILLKQQQQHVMNNIIYFLLSCQQSNLLFCEVQQQLHSLHLEDLLLDELSHYIEGTNGYKLKIPYMSQETLGRVVKRYRGKQWVLEGLLVQFDLSQMETLLLLTTCLRERLYQSLIGICAQQKDYITPIIKLCGVGFQQTGQRNRIAEVTFWYLAQCFDGAMTEYGNQQDYINMLAVLINFLFIPSSLEMLLHTSHTLLTQILLTLTHPRILRCVLENPQQFYMRAGEAGDPVFQEGSQGEYTLYERMLSTFVRVVEGSEAGQREQYQWSLNRLLAYLMLKNQFPFLPRLKLKIILFYLAHPALFLPFPDPPSEHQELMVNGHLMRLLDSLIRSIHQKSLFLKELSRDDAAAGEELAGVLRREKEKELQGLLQAMLLSSWGRHFGQTKCYILHELGRYGEVLEQFLRLSHRRTRSKIFDYLEHNLPHSSVLADQFQNHMVSLLRLDLKRAEVLIWKAAQGRAEEVIERLGEFPQVQLGLLEKAMSRGAQQSKKLLLKHLQIVLRERGNEVESYIQRIDYPLQQAFRMCEQRNNRMGKACILIKSGRNMEGVLIITQIFLEMIQDYLKSLFKKVDDDPTRRPRIMQQLQVVLNTCSKQWQIDNDRGEEIWEKNTELIFKKLNVNNIDSPHIPPNIRAVLDEVVTKLLESMLEQVSTDFFLHRFVKTFTALPLRIFTLAYHCIHHRLQFTFTLQKLNKQLLQAQELASWKAIRVAIQHGHVCALSCSACKHIPTINQRLLSYVCGHAFHEECYCELNNRKNRNQLCPSCYNAIDSFLTCGDAKMPRVRLQVDQRQIHRFQINRMSDYDRTAQFANLQSWSKFQQWVDL